MPLGISPDENYGPTTSIILEESDVLVMLTDGFFEWARPSDGQAFGTTRLQEALRTAAHQDAASGRWSAVSLNKQRDPASDAGKFMGDAATAFAVLALTR